MCVTEIKVKGKINHDWKEWFDGLDISYEGDITILKGAIKDDSSLYGIINRMRDLNLKLISLNPIK